MPAVAGYVEAAQAASRAPVRKVVVMGKWTNAGCFGWLCEVSYRVIWVGWMRAYFDMLTSGLVCSYKIGEHLCVMCSESIEQEEGGESSCPAKEWRLKICHRQRLRFMRSRESALHGYSRSSIGRNNMH
jgi:hypothetical protein